MSSFILQEFIFDPFEDLMNLKDIPKVTRCLALMAKMVNLNSMHLCKSDSRRLE